MWRALASVVGWQVTASICYYAVFAATPFFRDAFGLSRFGVGLIVTALTLGQLAFLLPAGAAVDAYGERRMLLVGLGVLAVGAAGVGMAWAIPAVAVAVFCLGGAYAVSMPGTNRAVFESIPSPRRNLGMGVKQVGVTVGSACSAVAIPVLAVVGPGWETGFFLAAALATLVTIAFALLYGETGGTGRFVRPTLGGPLGDSAYWQLTAAGVVLGAVLFVTTSYTILYLDEVVDIPVALAGATLAGMQTAGSIGRVVFGHLVDRLGTGATAATRVLLGLTVAIAVGAGVVAMVTGPVAVVLGFLTLGFVVFGYTGVFFSAIGSLVPDDRVGGASAGGQIALNLGALVAPPAFGLIADGPGYRVGWLLVAGCAIIATGLLVRVEIAARTRAVAPSDETA
jgi:MFS family permease